METNCSYFNPVELVVSSTRTIAFSSSTCSTTTSSVPAVANGFTYGEVVISVLLFLIFCSALYWPFFFWTAGMKIKNR